MPCGNVHVHCACVALISKAVHRCCAKSSAHSHSLKPPAGELSFDDSWQSVSAECSLERCAGGGHPGKIKVFPQFHVGCAHCELTFIFTWNNITVSSLWGLRYGTT